MMCPAIVPAASRSQASSRPAELVHQRAERQGGVGDPPGEHDLGALLQSLGDRARPEISVDREHLGALVHERALGLHVLEAAAGGEQLVHMREEVVALDHPDPQARDAELPGDPQHLVAARGRVEAAGVRHHLDAALDDRGQGPAQQRDEVRGETLVGIAEALAHHDRERDLGQVVEAEVVERPAGEELQRRVDAVPPETLAVADANESFHASPRATQFSGFRPLAATGGDGVPSRGRSIAKIAKSTGMGRPQ